MLLLLKNQMVRALGDSMTNLLQERVEPWVSHRSVLIAARMPRKRWARTRLVTLAFWIGHARVVVVAIEASDKRICLGPLPVALHFVRKEV
eukprot:COSAG02_NODE_42198_length_386_cov_1.933798_1_plen_90_part_10